MFRTLIYTLSINFYTVPTLKQGRFKGRARGPRPPVKILPLCGPPMKFMIKHNLPLVRGGSLWQYMPVLPSCNYGHPTGPQNRHCAKHTVSQKNYSVTFSNKCNQSDKILIILVNRYLHLLTCTFQRCLKNREQATEIFQ